jgi:hypothetical protein
MPDRGECTDASADAECRDARSAPPSPRASPEGSSSGRPCSVRMTLAVAVPDGKRRFSRRMVCVRSGTAMNTPRNACGARRACLGCRVAHAQQGWLRVVHAQPPPPDTFETPASGPALLHPPRCAGCHVQACKEPASVRGAMQTWSDAITSVRAGSTRSLRAHQGEGPEEQLADVQGQRAPGVLRLGHHAERGDDADQAWHPGHSLSGTTSCPCQRHRLQQRTRMASAGRAPSAWAAAGGCMQATTASRPLRRTTINRQCHQRMLRARRRWGSDRPARELRTGGQRHGGRGDGRGLQDHILADAQLPEPVALQHLERAKAQDGRLRRALARLGDDAFNACYVRLTLMRHRVCRCRCRFCPRASRLLVPRCSCLRLPAITNTCAVANCQ